MIDIFEMKYSGSPFAITKKYSDELNNKISTFRASVKKRMSIHLVLVTSDGLQQNEYAASLVQNTILLDDLFCI